MTMNKHSNLHTSLDRHKEADTMFRQSLRGREKTLGYNNHDIHKARKSMNKAHRRATDLEPS
ncbi:hypothetical protein N7449_011468 [Penicillium cf. viridicatum]|uniref:Uncharacterized protein n=1 Tax=Penicillium cf. viridicatum TaxID=2972119 RepID=A0A9W9IX59_9EURO|nr:hypothetical protein N7449_011468 [Penicillium cf. viridicatum]